MRKVHVFVVALVLSMSGLAFSAPKQYKGNHFLGDMVGQDCAYFLTLPRPTQARQQMYGLKLLGLRNEPEMQALWQQMNRQAGSGAEQHLGAAPSELIKQGQSFIKLFDRQMSVAVVRGSEISGYHGPFEEFFTELALGEWVILLESSSSADKVRKHLKEFASGPAARTFWEGGLTRETIGNVRAYAPASSGLSLFVARRGSAVVAASRNSLLRKTMDAFEDKPDEVLSDVSSYQKAMQQGARNDASMMVYWNVAKSIERTRSGLEDFERKEFDTTMSLLGLDAVSAYWKGQGKRARFRVDLSVGDRPGSLWKSFQARPNRMNTAAAVPEDAFVYTSAMLSVRKGAENILQTIEEAEFEGETPETGRRAESRAEFEAFKEAVKTLAPQVGPEVAFYGRFPSGGGMVPNAGFIAQVQDPMSVEDDLRSLLDLMETKEMKKIPYLDYTIHTMPGRGMPFGLSFAVLDRNLVLGLTPEAVKEVISVTRKPEDSLQRSEEFAKVLKPLPDEHNGVFFLDTRRAGLFAYNTVKSFMTGMSRHGSGGMPFDPAALPTPDTLGAHLGNSVCIFRRTDGDVSSKGYSAGVDPLSLCGLSMVQAPFVGSMMASMATENIASACRGMLRREISGPPMDNEAVLPDTQLQFLKKYMDEDRKNLTCPVDRNPTELGEGYKTSFTYFPAKIDKDMKWGGQSASGFGAPGQDTSMEEMRERMREMREGGDKIVLYEDKARHGRRTVLSASRMRSTRLLEEDEFQKLLRKQKKEYGLLSEKNGSSEQ